MAAVERGIRSELLGSDLMQFEHRTIFESSLVTLGTFRCPADHPSFSLPGSANGHLVVFPRSTVRIVVDQHRPLIADPNVALFYNAHQEYRREPLGACGDRCEWFAFPASVITTLSNRFDSNARQRLDRPFPTASTATNAATYLAQRQIFRHITAAGPRVDRSWVEESALQILKQCIASTYRIRGYSARKLSPATEREHRHLVRSARQVLATRFRSRLTLDELASDVGCSPFHLSRLFRRIVGQSIHQYLTQLRLRTSLEEMERNAKGLTELALDLGFSSHSHFTYAFRQHFGLTPTQWQKRGRVQSAMSLA